MIVLEFRQKKIFWIIIRTNTFAVKNKNKYTFNYEDIMIEAKTGSKKI